MIHFKSFSSNHQIVNKRKKICWLQAWHKWLNPPKNPFNLFVHRFDYTISPNNGIHIADNTWTCRILSKNPQFHCGAHTANYSVPYLMPITPIFNTISSKFLLCAITVTVTYHQFAHNLLLLLQWQCRKILAAVQMNYVFGMFFNEHFW